MRVCLVTGQFATPFSGVGTYARALAAGMRKAGWEVRVVCPPGQVDAASGFEFMAAPVRLLPGHARWLGCAYAFARLLRHVADADIVHFLDAREGLSYAGPVATVGTIHDYYFVDPGHFWRHRSHYPDWPTRMAYSWCTRFLEGRAYRRLGSLIANSDSTRTRVTSAYGLVGTVRTVHIGLDLTSAEAEQESRCDGILFVGGNPFRKGLDRLIRCLPRIPERVELWIAGAAVPPRCEALARRLGVWSRVRQHGMVHGDSLRHLYRKAKVLALPGVTEAFGLVFMEAMAARCAVIGPTDGGAGELIEDGVTGYLVPHDDDVLLVRRLVTLLTDDALRREMTDRAAEEVSGYTVRRMADQTLEVYGASRAGTRHEARGTGD